MESKARICLMAGAYGDAFGYAVEFDEWRRIKARFGPEGMREFPPGQDFLATDDTQMALFACEALLEQKDWGQERDLMDRVAGKYLAWLAAQSGRARAGALPSDLARDARMQARRAPGNTCLSALADLSEGPRAGNMGTPQDPPNDSKGCGAAMRAAPFGLAASSPEQAFRWGCQQGAITHGHIDGFVSAGAFARICHDLLQGEDLAEAARRAADRSREEGAVSTADLLEKALSLKGKRLRPEEIPEQLGLGWVGDEALAIALWAALAAESLKDCAALAANHDGDSDSTAMMACQLRALSAGVSPEEMPLLGRSDMAPLCQSLGEKLDGRLGGIPAAKRPPAGKIAR